MIGSERRFIFLLVLGNQCTVWVDLLVVELAVLVLDRVDDVLTTLQRQLDAQLEPPVPALHHGLHLAGLHHTRPLRPQLVEGRLDVVVVDAPAAVVDEDGPEAQFVCVMGSGGWVSGVSLDVKMILTLPTQTSVAIPQTYTSQQSSARIISSRDVLPSLALESKE